MNSQFLCSQAVKHLQSGNLAQADLIYQQVLASEPGNVTANQMLAVVRAQQGRNEEALTLIEAALCKAPRSASVLANYGNILHALGRSRESLRAFEEALKCEPHHAMLHCNRGRVLQELGRFQDAIASFDRAVALNASYVEAIHGRGLALKNVGRLDESLACFDRVLFLRPNFAEAIYNRALVLSAMDRFEDALSGYEKALTINAALAEAWNGHGNALRELKRFEEALRSYEMVLKLKPDFPEGLNNRGIALWSLNRFEDAMASYNAALDIKPDYSDALNNRGICLASLKRFDEALTDFERSLAIDPDSTETLYNRADSLRALKRFEEAFESYNRVLSIRPDHPYALGGAANALLNVCGWSQTSEIATNIQGHVRKSVVAPFTLLGYVDDPALQLECATTYVRDKSPARQNAMWNGRPYRHDKIRIAYLSADFCEHATAFLAAELFEIHDRTRFEVLAISYGLDDGSAMRRRLVGAFDVFHDVHAKSDYEVARLLHGSEVDIAIDLKGHTQDSRLGILSYRPCPVQAHYLGYPGTLGAEFIDYLIADQYVAPFDQQRFFAEKIVHLPDSYQVNDSRRAAAESTPSRREAGLPEEGFVFCCFNNSWKIGPSIFAVWMRLLNHIPNSVLWLVEDNTGASSRLMAEALEHGVDPKRLVFAERLALDEHLARHRLADLFLDTLPYNAHTTASDALWMGVPIVTCRGTCFAGRVASSLLNAAGLPELVTQSLEQYETLAEKIANDAALLRNLKGRLKDAHRTCRLFDSHRFRRAIEAAYAKMWQIAEAGESPRSFSVSLPQV